MSGERWATSPGVEQTDHIGVCIVCTWPRGEHREGEGCPPYCSECWGAGCDLCEPSSSDDTRTVGQ